MLLLFYSYSSCLQLIASLLSHVLMLTANIPRGATLLLPSCGLFVLLSLLLWAPQEPSQMTAECAQLPLMVRRMTGPTPLLTFAVLQTLWLTMSPIATSAETADSYYSTNHSKLTGLSAQSTSSSQREVHPHDPNELIPSPAESKEEVDLDSLDPRFLKLTEALSYRYAVDPKEQNPRQALKLLTEVVSEASDTPSELDPVTAQALFELGQLFYYGAEGFRGIRRDLKKAISYFNQSALFGFGPPLHMLSIVAASGLNDLISTNEKTAVRLEYLAAVVNYYPAIMGMGFRFRYGHGIHQSCDLALKHYKVAGVTALTDLGIGQQPLQDNDRIGDKTLQKMAQSKQMESQETEIMDYLEMAAGSGDPMAQYELATRIGEKNGSSKEQLKWYEKAADAKLAPAIRDLGASYLHGLGVEMDVEKGIALLKEAAKLGDPEAANVLGVIYLYGDPTIYKIETNLETARYYFMQAALQDFGESLFYLGDIQLYYGTGSSEKNLTEMDYKIALLYYDRAVNNGYILANKRIADLYENGSVSSLSCEEAVQAYKSIAEASFLTDELRKGMEYYKKRDYEGALLVNVLHAEEGFEVAQSNAAWLYKNQKGCTGKSCFFKALRLLYLSHLQGNPHALYDIADIYLNGRGGIKEDNFIAIKMLKLSLQQGDIRALPAMASFFEKGADHIQRDFDKAETLLMYALDQLRNGDSSNLGLNTKPTMKDNMVKLSKISRIIAQLAKIRIQRRLSKS